MYYVTMTDKFMSDWGMSAGKINKFVILCKDRTQAHQIADHADTRSELTHVSIRSTKPSYPTRTHYVSWTEYSNMGGVWLNETARKGE